MDDQQNAIRAEYEAMESRIDATLARMQADMAQGRENAERRDKEFAQRETRLILTMGGMIAIAVAIIGILIRWPAPPV